MPRVPPLTYHEATFRSLVSSSFWQPLSSHGILVTGKGYPDMATRLLLRSIAIPSSRNNFKAPPVFGLFDSDPDGLDILSTYKHGSTVLAHEKADLELPCLQWLGLSSEALGGASDLHESQGQLKLSDRDRKKAIRMLERETFKLELEWRREVQMMLMLNVKAEIQILDAKEGGLVSWLEAKGIS
jgi:meiotic recombination protein SPO11